MSTARKLITRTVYRVILLSSVILITLLSLAQPASARLEIKQGQITQDAASFAPGQFPDNTLIREQGQTRVYVVIGGAALYVPTPAQLAPYGGAAAIRNVPAGTLSTLPRIPRDNTLIREQGQTRVYVIDKQTKRYIPTPAELAPYGGVAAIRNVPNGTLQAIPTFTTPAQPAPVPAPSPAWLCGPNDVGGAIGTKWRALGAGSGVLGCPTSGEYHTIRNWIVRDFQRGAVYHNGHAEYAVYGAIFASFKADGRERYWGLPITDELPTRDGTGRYNHFELGTLVWHPNKPMDGYWPQYNFVVNRYSIGRTRSRHEDTNYVYAAVHKNRDLIADAMRSMGDQNDGTYDANVGRNVYLDDENAVYTFVYAIKNAGHETPGVVKDGFKQVGQAAAKYASEQAAKYVGQAAGSLVGTGIGGAIGGIVGAGVGALIGWATGKGVDMLFADCDGYVADATIVANLPQLALWTENRQVHTEEYYHPGYDSPEGCGANSRYWVTWSLQRVDP